MFEKNRSNSYVQLQLDQWIELAGNDSVNKRKRQVAEITLHAISLDEKLAKTLVLKGGSLLAIVYHSPRFTTDLDFTVCDFNPNYPEVLQAGLDQAFLRSATSLGYTNIRCRVQKIEKKPKPTIFAEAKAPALKVTIGYVSSITPASLQRLEDGRAPETLVIDLSFQEPLVFIERAFLKGRVDTDFPPKSIYIYSLTELMAEKFRAYLQQKERERNRRQDIYDLSYLIGHYSDGMDKKHILEVLLVKARARNIEPTKEMVEDQELVERAKRDWGTLKAEVGSIPEFDECFAVVREFYQSLPWDDV